jgi:HK97 family phage major capsid protein
MKKSDVLKEKRASKIAAQSALLTVLSTESRQDFTEDETANFNALEVEINGFTDQIDAALVIEAAATRNAILSTQGPVSMATSNNEQKDKRALSSRASVTKAIRSVTNGNGLSGAEKEMNELAIEESRNAGVEVPENSKVNIPMSFLRATAQTVSEDSGNYGGQLVNDQAPRAQMGFSAGGVMDRLGATRLTGLVGGDIPLPVLGNYDFSWLSETGAIVPQKQQITGPKLSPNRLGAAVDLSNRLLVQSSLSVESMIRELLLQGYNKAIDAAAINGSGSANQPTGILNKAGVNQGTSSESVAPTKALIAELIKLVETANATNTNISFLGSPTMKYLLEITKLDAGSGRFLMEKMDELLGYNFVSSTLVPQLATNSPLIYGDFSQLFIGEWGSMSVLSDPFSGSLSNSVRVVINGHADVAIAQPTAFSVNKWFKEI